MSDALKLTIYFGESDRVEGHLLTDVLFDRFERHGVLTAILMRAVEGFGFKHKLRTDRFLSMSEDLPLVAVAVDERPRIEALLPEITPLVEDGLITLERARLVTAGGAGYDLDEEAKLTLYVGRDHRPTYVDVVDHLYDSGLAGATVLLGVDGMQERRRERARFFSRNAGVPAMVVSVGRRDAVERALAGIGSTVATIERIRVCKRDGELIAEPSHLPEQDDAGLGIWQKLMVYAGEQARHGGHPLYTQIVRRLREERASGTTALRGVWGFSGDHAPHGDRITSLRRRVPVVVTIVDTPTAIQRWFRIVDELTDEAGLVTSELVPAFRAITPERAFGGLRLSRARLD